MAFDNKFEAHWIGAFADINKNTRTDPSRGKQEETHRLAGRDSRIFSTVFGASAAARNIGGAQYERVGNKWTRRVWPSGEFGGWQMSLERGDRTGERCKPSELASLLVC